MSLTFGRTVHAGEGRPSAEIRVAIEALFAERIGHGVTLAEAGKELTAMALYAWSELYHDPASSLVDPAAMPVFEQLAHDCIESVAEFAAIENAAIAILNVRAMNDGVKQQA